MPTAPGEASPTATATSASLYTCWPSNPNLSRSIPRWLPMWMPASRPMWTPISKIRSMPRSRPCMPPSISRSPRAAHNSCSPAIYRSPASEATASPRKATSASWPTDRASSCPSCSPRNRISSPTCSIPPPSGTPRCMRRCTTSGRLTSARCPSIPHSILTSPPMMCSSLIS